MTLLEYKHISGISQVTMKKYWTSNNIKSVVDDRRKELDLLIEYANADLNQMKHQSVWSSIMDRVGRHEALHPDNRDWRPKGNLSAAEVLIVLQKHLLARLNSIIRNKEMLWEMPLWRVRGTIRFTSAAHLSRFQERFQLQKEKPGKEIKAFKKILDLWLIEIIRGIDFSPQRFGQCPQCGNFFYSPTIKKRIYCSKRCGGAARQEKYRRARKIDDQ